MCRLDDKTTTRAIITKELRGRGSLFGIENDESGQLSQIFRPPVTQL
jgi:hypothetical protein